MIKSFGFFYIYNMKFIYLKKFNESYLDEECSFETFKEILYDLSDDYECDFHDFSTDSDPFYDCRMTIPKSIEIDSSYDILKDVVSSFDDPHEIETDNDFDYVINEITSNTSKMKSLKNEIDLIIDRNKRLKQIFNTLKEHIVPRLRSFSNCYRVSFGYDSGDDVLRICFDLPTNDD